MRSAVIRRRRPPSLAGDLAWLSGCHVGRAPHKQGQRYPADPPTIDEIVAAMRQAGNGRHGPWARAPIVVLWRAGLRIHEALALAETDLDAGRGSARSARKG